MSNIISDYKQVVSETQKLLLDNIEWEDRFSCYADDILTNIKKIRENKSKFRVLSPLYLYMSVSEAKSSVKFSLRYLGQQVAVIKIANDKITVSTKGCVETNLRDFDCPIKLNDVDWQSREATSFRKHFFAYGKRTTMSSKKNEEHRIESLLLTEFSKRNSKTKLMCNIQTVRLAGVARFQMPTPLSASKVDSLKYSGTSGGGIDILARIGKGHGTKLCVLEVKDENTKKEPPSKVIKQAIAYATFLLSLLRSKGGAKWWNLFGFTGNLPNSIQIAVACVMPSDIKDISFSKKVIMIGNDMLILHYVYFNDDDNQIIEIDTSMIECEIMRNGNLV